MYHKWKSYDVWFLRYGMHAPDRIFSHFGLFFVLLPPNNAENQNFEKMKKTPGDIIISHKCTTNENHIIYDSWYMKCDRQNFLSFWATFYPFNPLATQKIKILKKWNKHLEVSSFYTSVPKIMIICYTVPEIWHDRQLFFILGYFLPFYPCNSPKNQSFKKMKKSTWRHHYFAYMYQKIVIWWCMVPMIWCATDG